MIGPPVGLMRSPVVPGRVRLEAGFTVLELIVALTLSLVLMAAVWTMFNTMIRRQEVDTARTDRVQIVRGLHQILTRDLQQIVPPAATRQPDAGGVPIDEGIALFMQPSPFGDVRRNSRNSNVAEGLVSLKGTRERLELTVLADTTEVVEADRSLPGDGGMESESSHPREGGSGAYRSIVYHWRPFPGSGDSLDDELVAPSDHVSEVQGLFRQESSRADRAGAANQSERSDRSERTSRAHRTEPTFSRRNDQDADPSAETVTPEEEQVSEVIRCEFSYFDGRGWRESWNSTESLQLPRAVRVRLDLETRRDRREKLAQRADSSSGSPVLADDSWPTPSDPLFPRSELETEQPFDFEFLILLREFPPGPVATTLGERQSRIPGRAERKR